MKTLKNKSNTRHSSFSTRKQFLYNPKKPKKTFDVYTNDNPVDTIHIKYTTVQDVENTIHHLENLYKQKRYDHKRIWQVGMIMKVRLGVMKEKKKRQYDLANRYFHFLGRRTKLSNEDRYKLVFKV